MNSLIIGQKYIITRKYDESKKPAITNEWLVEVLALNRDLLTVNVKFITGALLLVGKVREIKYTNYDFQFAGDKIKEGSMQFKAIQSEYHSNLDEFKKLRDEIQKNSKYYKDLELEVLFLRGAIIVIVWMYIWGTIQFV